MKNIEIYPHTRDLNYEINSPLEDKVGFGIDAIHPPST